MANTRASNTEDFAATDFTTRAIRTPNTYVGFSHDPKPTSPDENTVPYLSTFYEVDTGRTAYWDGFDWHMGPDHNARIVELLNDVVNALQELKEFHAEVAADF